MRPIAADDFDMILSDEELRYHVGIEWVTQ
jgi:hypothetical protein